LRVLFASFPGASHFYPMVPLAWALRSAGHEVRVAGPPLLAPAVTHSGLPFVPVGPERDLEAEWREKHVVPLARQAWERHEERRTPRAILLFTLVAEAMAGDLTTFARAWDPDLVVFEPRAYAGAMAAQLLGVPAVRHLWGPDYTYERWENERPHLAALYERHGLGEPGLMRYLTIDPCPPALQVETTPRRRLVRYVPYNGSSVVPDWLLGEPPELPRVCVTWGTSYARIAGDLAPVLTVTDALAALDVEVVVAASAAHRHLLRTLPPRVRLAESLPLHVLLPTCRAIVHQGGAGTTLTALTCGIPQLVMPGIADEFLNAGRLAESGAGLSLGLRSATAGDIRSAVDDLLTTPAWRETAGRIGGQSHALEPAAALVPELERLAR
jgi:UDP:flavonoid glycosyltransferase YjiC (YdhE family)